MTTQPTLADHYLGALSLPEAQTDSNDQSSAYLALARAHELRKFEIENYWKRATYFWAFQLTAFTFLGLIWRETVGSNAALHRYALLIPAGLGAVTGVVGALTARGSKFWQENWEAHVDALEGQIEGRLTQLVFVRGSTLFSVSRVNERLLDILALGWLALFGSIAFGLDIVVPTRLQPLLACGLLLIALAWICFGTRTRLSGLQIRAGETLWTTTKARRKKAVHLVLRNTALAAASPVTSSSHPDGVP